MKTQDILKSLNIKCTLGTWEYHDNYYCISWNSRQAESWVKKLRKAGYKAAWTLETHAYVVSFTK